LRSWCIDTTGSFAPDYVWHEATRDWRTPGDGEVAVASLLRMGVPGRTSLYESLGMSPVVGKEMAEAFDETMGRCILSLYRSVPQDVLAQWSAQVPAASARPGLVLFPTDDGYSGGAARHRWVAEQTGARFTVLEGLGHWWLLQDPAAGAAALRHFWKTV
jgi:hypothetical protein